MDNANGFSTGKDGEGPFRLSRGGEGKLCMRAKEIGRATRCAKDVEGLGWERGKDTLRVVEQLQLPGASIGERRSQLKNVNVRNEGFSS